MTGRRMARALGWLSVGLGLAEVAAPKQVGRLIGVKGREGVLRALGARELASGVGLLASPPRPGPLSKWAWSRVGGDALDLALLGAALSSKKGRPGRKRRGALAAATGAVAAVTALDLICARGLTRR
jgi:hypothetical protein